MPDSAGCLEGTFRDRREGIMNQQLRRERLESALFTLAAWALNQAKHGTEVDKPLAKLERSVAEIRGSVDRAGMKEPKK